MAKRSIPDPPPFPASALSDNGRDHPGPRFDAHFDEIRQRAAQWSATGARLSAAVARRAPGHAAERARQSPGAHALGAPALSQPARGRNRRASVSNSNSHRGASANGQSSNESWQYRQLEVLERIDENIRRIRELQESARSPQSAFTEPAY